MKRLLLIVLVWHILPLLTGAQPSAFYPINGRGVFSADPEMGAADISQRHLFGRFPNLAPDDPLAPGYARVPPRQASLGMPTVGDNDPRGVNVFAVALLQGAIDHDLVLTPNCPSGVNETQWQIVVGSDDPVFPPDTPLAFTPHCDPPTNQQTAWLDGSFVYGTSEGVAAKLRDPATGLMRTQSLVLASGEVVELLPLAGDVDLADFMANPVGRVPTSELRAAGDVRANETPFLLAVHTLFVREHNLRVRRIIAREGPASSPTEALRRWHVAREGVIELLQRIVYEELLPLFVDRTRLDASIGYYRAQADRVRNGQAVVPDGHFRVDSADIPVEWAAWAFRFGHSMPPSFVPRQGSDPLELGGSFFSQLAAEPGRDPIGAVVAGIINTPAGRIDSVIPAALRHRLMAGSPRACAESGQCGMDLAAININRGRSDAVASFEQTRHSMGLPAFHPTAETRQFLLSIYGPAHSSGIDPWVGGLLESGQRTDGKLGSTMGTLVREVMAAIAGYDDRFYRFKTTRRRVVGEGDGSGSMGEMVFNNLVPQDCEHIDGAGSMMTMSSPPSPQQAIVAAAAETTSSTPPPSSSSSSSGLKTGEIVGIIIGVAVVFIVLSALVYRAYIHHTTAEVVVDRSSRLPKDLERGPSSRVRVARSRAAPPDPPPKVRKSGRKRKKTTPFSIG